MKLKHISHITGTIELLTGLHIGAGKDSIEIGGLDLPVIKNPISKAPYIPGSSFKGKMRSLLETYYMFKGNKHDSVVPNIINTEGIPCGCCKCYICKIFGAHSSKPEKEALGPTRILLRDAMLTEEFRQRHDNAALPMEVKYENTINRISGTAENPRPVERVPAGVEFSFHISLKEYEGDDAECIFNVLKDGLKLIELDALGGHSSRGSGQVRFKDMQKDGKKFSLDEALT